MINELYGLARTLDNMDLTIQEWHREYKPLPKVTNKAPCIRLWLSDDGTVIDYECISAEQAQFVRKFGSNLNSFPAFNIVPMYRITNEVWNNKLDEIDKDVSKIDIDLVKSWCKKNNWRGSVVDKVNRCLHNIPQRLIDMIHLDNNYDNCVIAKLAQITSQITADDLMSSLVNCIFQKISNNEDVALSLYLLFNRSNTQKDAKDDIGNNISIVLDVKYWEQYKHPVASEYTTNLLNESLMISQQENNSTDEHCTDAFGMSFINPNEPMPTVRLSGFDVILRSMFNGQPCQYRYDNIDDASYPISVENRSSIKRSLEWVAAPSRDEITWRKVDKNEIVFVYPSKLPKIPPKFASIFGSASTRNVEQIESRFENVAKEYVKAFNGIPIKERPDNIMLFTIIKIDKGRSKVVFTHNTTPEKLVQASNDWVIGCNNIPDLDVECISPFPLQIARIVNNVWKQNGELAQGKNTVSRMKHYQGMELFLDIMQFEILQNFLRVLLVNSWGLVTHYGNYIHGSYKDDNGKKLYLQEKEIQQLFSVFGLLLYKCKIRKEVYMENMAFCVGQLLHISDELHALYCKVVRNGDLPPQLAGSSLFATACEIPNLAISQLAIRINPYIAWAKQYRYKNIEVKGEESWRAGWYLSLYELTSNKLAQVISNVRFNDYEKAQLFIGYMASFPKKATGETTNENENIGG